jgi:nucleoside-diphosphate-sugar epimerase
VSRGRGTHRLLGMHAVGLDFRSATLVDWLVYLADVDAVIDCVGVLQGNGSGSPEASHARGPAVLFDACEAVGVRRVIHFSAVGVDRGARSSFPRARRDADLQARDLDWVILRPAGVLGRPV